jgi:hypothetical protein
MSAHIYTVKELARILAVSDNELHATADRLNLPYDLRHGVNRKGEPIARRVYLRALVDPALDERGRRSQRGTAA